MSDLPDGPSRFADWTPENVTITPPPDEDEEDPLPLTNPSPAVIIKVDEEQRMIWGWASVTSERGVPIVDRQGDVLDDEELMPAVHQFMTDSRSGGNMHKQMGIGTVVESMVFTPALQAALGIDLQKTGWFVGIKVADDATWAAVKNGTLRAFSLGGSGVRHPIEEA